MRTLTLCLVFLALLATAQAQVPELINYQGRLLQGTNLVNTSTSIVFRLYDEAGGGTLLYQETQNVQIVDGLYSVRIGENIPEPGSLAAAFTGRVVYLEIAVGDETLEPRERIASVAYAFSAGRALGASSLQAGTTNIMPTAPFQNSTMTLTILFSPPFDSVPIVTMSRQSLSLEALGTINAQIASVSTSNFTVQTSMTGKWISVVEARTSGTFTVRPTSLAEVNGKPAIAFIWSNVRYEQATDPNGLAWTNTAVVLNNSNNATQCSLAMVNGRPAMAHDDSVVDHLMYVRSYDADGKAWPATSITADASTDVGRYSSLAVVNGKPAISYLNSSNLDLMYIQAGDADGTVWTNPPVVVDTNDAAGVGTSLAVVNGRPAIGYTLLDLTMSTARLMYVRSDDADGFSWPTPIAVDTNGVTGLDPSLAVVDGRPAMAYHNASSTNVYFIRASDADGDAWNEAAILVHPANANYEMPRLAVIDGVPAIAFHYKNSNVLGYVRARDPEGDNWNTPVVADSTTNVGEYASLAEIHGRAAIGYWGSMKMLYAIDGGPAARINWVAVEP